MLGKISEYMLMKHVERKLGKYDIKMVHFIPGRIRLQSPRWKTNGTLIEEIVKELQDTTIGFFCSANYRNRKFGHYI